MVSDYKSPLDSYSMNDSTGLLVVLCFFPRIRKQNVEHNERRMEMSLGVASDVEKPSIATL